MAALSRVDSGQQLSTHSSLEEEEIDLEKDRQRKLTKAGQHLPRAKNISFAGTAYVANVAAKRHRARRKPGHDIASGLKTAGGVAIAGLAWQPNLFNRNKKAENDLYTAALAATTVAKAKRFHRKRDKAKTVASALEIAGGVAVAGAAWSAAKPNKDMNREQKQNKNLSLAGAALAAQAVAKAKLSKRLDPHKTVPNALKVAGSLAMDVALWTSPKETVEEPKPSLKHTMKGAGRAAHAIAKANIGYKRYKEYSIAEALRTAAGVAIAAAAWTKEAKELADEVVSPAVTIRSINVHSTQVTPIEQPLLVDMATSPIPQLQTSTPSPVPIVLPDPTPEPREITPENLESVHASSPSTSPTPNLTPPPSIPPNSAQTPAIVKVNTPSPSPVIVVQPVKSPTPTPAKTPTPVKNPTPTPNPIIKSASPVKTPTPTPNPIIKSASPVKTPTPVKSPTPSPKVVVIPTPTPEVVHTSNTVVRTQEETRERRGDRRPGAFLIAAAALDRRQQRQPLKAPTPAARSPTPVVNHQTPRVFNPPPTITHQKETPAVQVQPPTPNEVPEEDIEEIHIPEEQAQTVAIAASGVPNPKPKRKPLARLTPLEQIAAKTRSLQ